MTSESEPASEQLKQEGNELFKQHEFQKALGCYTEALAECPDDRDDLRAIYYGNMSACQFYSEDYEGCVKSCSKALDIDSEYTKVRARRYKANDKIDNWQSLESCVEDLKVLEKSATDQKAKQQYKTAMAAIEVRLKTRQQEETDKMLGKLKDLGNGVLQNFGMSLDDFKMNKKEDGSYSIGTSE